MKQLHIGPGRDKLPGFDTLDIRPGYDIQADAAGPLPIADNTYDLIYASHIIEHVPWWKTIDTLKEWNRILKPGGTCEIWTVNAAKVMRYALDCEDGFGEVWFPDNWKRNNPTRNPFLWAAGRIFAYGNDANDPNWHKAMFTPRHLRACCIDAGFPQTSWLDRQKVRGKDHGWVNLGIEARKTSD